MPARIAVLVTVLLGVLPAAAQAANTVRLVVSPNPVAGAPATFTVSGSLSGEGRIQLVLAAPRSTSCLTPTPGERPILDQPLPAGPFSSAVAPILLRAGSQTVCARLIDATPKRVGQVVRTFQVRPPRTTLVTKAAAPRFVRGTPVATTTSGTIETPGRLLLAWGQICPAEPPADAARTDVSGPFSVASASPPPDANTRLCSWLAIPGGSAVTSAEYQPGVELPSGTLVLSVKKATVARGARFGARLRGVAEVPTDLRLWLTRRGPCSPRSPYDATRIPVAPGAYDVTRTLKAPKARGRFRVCTRIVSRYGTVSRRVVRAR